MSSHSVRLAKNLRDIEQLIKEQISKSDLSEYDRGRVNGLILCMSLLTGKDRYYIGSEATNEQE